MLITKRNIKKVYNNNKVADDVVTEIIVVGRTTKAIKDCQCNYFTGANGEQTAVLNVDIAVNGYNKNDETKFYKSAFFGGKADTLLKLNLNKGAQLVIVGVLKLNQYTNKEGELINKEEITVDSFVVLDFNNKKEYTNNNANYNNANYQPLGPMDSEETKVKIGGNVVGLSNPVNLFKADANSEPVPEEVTEEDIKEEILSNSVTFDA